MQTGEDCVFFMGTGCSRGAECKYRHSEAARDNRTPRVCSYWTKGKSCTKVGCAFKHPAYQARKKAPVAGGNVRKPCAFFASGKCKNGDACAFQHGGEVVHIAGSLEARKNSELSSARPVSRKREIKEQGARVSFGVKPLSELQQEPQRKKVVVKKRKTEPREEEEEEEEHEDEDDDELSI